MNQEIDATSHWMSNENFFTLKKDFQYKILIIACLTPKIISKFKLN